MLGLAFALYARRRQVGSTCPAKDRFGRDAPESGRVMLTLSFVVRDPKPTSARWTVDGIEQHPQRLRLFDRIAEPPDRLALSCFARVRAS